MIEEFLLGFVSGVAANSITEAFKKLFNKQRNQNSTEYGTDGFRSVDEYNSLKVMLIELMDDLSTLTYVFDSLSRRGQLPPTHDQKDVDTVSERVHRDILSLERLSPFGFDLFSNQLATCAREYCQSSIPDGEARVVDPYVNRLISELHSRNVESFAYAFQMQRIFTADEAISLLEQKVTGKSKRPSKSQKELLIRKASAAFVLSLLLKRASQTTFFQLDVFQPQ